MTTTTDDSCCCADNKAISADDNTIASNTPNADESAVKKCECISCNNKPTSKLKIVRHLKDGSFCQECAIDLKWHGIAEEDIAFTDSHLNWNPNEAKE